MASGVGLSDPGPVRKGNEDTFVCASDLGLFVVADGMGGHNAGEIASQLAVETIVGFIRRTAENDEFSWPYGIDPLLSLDANRLKTAVHLANRRVFREAEAHDDYSGMGTTVVTALVAGQKLVVAHVGDSRLYLRANGSLQRLTKDDSWAATILAQELGDKAVIAKHPMRNVLTNVLGAREQTDVHIAELELSGDELLLLCSDGLHSVIEDQEIAKHLESAEDLDAAAKRLIAAAIAAGTRDNVTVVLTMCART
jgi:PPM family protein phosphatase